MEATFQHWHRVHVTIGRAFRHGAGQGKNQIIRMNRYGGFLSIDHGPQSGYGLFVPAYLKIDIMNARVELDLHALVPQQTCQGTTKLSY